MRRSRNAHAWRNARAAVLTLLVGLVLTGCQGGSDVRPEELEAERAALAMLAEGRATEAAYEFLRLAREATDPERARGYRLQAVEALLEAGDAASAARVLDQELPGDLPQPDAYRRDVARAEIALLEGDPIRAVEILGRPAPPDLPAALANRATRVRARALARVGNNLEAARALLALETTLDTPESVDRNRREAWQALTRVSLPALERARVPPPDEFGGWVELAIVFSSSFMDPESFNQRLAAWRLRFPGHAALEAIVPELTLASVELGRAPTRVALLLPLDGPFASAAQAVRDGFVAAWYTDDPATRPAVSIHDSSGEDIWPVYRAAVEEGAEFVVGPLRRPLVSALSAEDTLAVPTLALNHASAPAPDDEGVAPGDGASGETIGAAGEETAAATGYPLADDPVQPTSPAWSEAGEEPAVSALATPTQPQAQTFGMAPGERAPTEGLFQFALSPEEEARQVAERAWFDGHARAVVIAPQGSWGDRVSAAFGEAWEEFGGEVVGEVTYEPTAVDLSGPVAALLAVDASEERYRALRRIVGSGLKAEARRRQDVDFVFMAAFPNQARQLRPQFKFHHAADVPVYSTSHVFAGTADPGADGDIDGVMFGDMPWALDAALPEADLRRRVEALWPDTVASYLRLYAFGADAYSLVGRIGRLRAQAQAEYRGATGRLSVAPDNRIHRRLTWGRFVRGRPVLIDEDVADPAIGASRDPFEQEATATTPIVVPRAVPRGAPASDTTPER